MKIRLKSYILLALFMMQIAKKKKKSIMQSICRSNPKSARRKFNVSILSCDLKLNDMSHWKKLSCAHSESQYQTTQSDHGLLCPHH